jgi:hypothetical protein
MTFPSGAIIRTLELGWHDNKPDVSCIPPGRYRCGYTWSPKFQEKLYLLADTEPRTGVRIHTGNHAGDVSAGLKSDVEGCILTGRYRTSIDGQRAVGGSRDALQDLYDQMGYADFMLEIRGAA